MSFLLKSDYLSKARVDNIDTITGSNDALLEEIEIESISEILGYLTSRYDMTTEFPDTFDFDSGDDYTVGQVVKEAGVFFLCIQDKAAPADTSDTDFFTAGDPRAAMLKRFVINLTLFSLHSRINPRNIPEHRIKLRDDDVALLVKYSSPKHNVNATFLTELTFAEGRGNNVSFGSNLANPHSY